MSPRSPGDGRTRPTWGSPPAPPARRAPAPAARAANGGRAGSRAAAAPAKRAQRSAPRPAPRRRPGRRRGRFHQRYGVVYETDGPHVRLGVLWFATALGALVAGPLGAAVVYGVAAAAAAAQTARAWHVAAPRPSDLMAGAGAALVAAGASFGAGGAGLGILGAVALAFVGAAGDQQSPNARIADIGWTLQCALAPGLAAMSVVLLARYDQGSAIGLLLLVSAYEAGDYLIGSGSPNAFEGPGAGAAGIVVITFILSTLPISALSFGQAWALGGAVAVLAPVGQLLASALLPSAAAPAPALRRLDSLLLAAPVWAWAVGLVLQ
jgi:hypothetical protein